MDKRDARSLALDVRNLEPPEPLTRTLAAPEILPLGDTMIQVNLCVPQFLRPLLSGGPVAGSHERPQSMTPMAHTRPDLREEDILGVLVLFYENVAEDPLLASYFASVDMAAHMPRIVDFWSTIVFQTGRYGGNAFWPHLEMPGLTFTLAGGWRRWRRRLMKPTRVKTQSA